MLLQEKLDRGEWIAIVGDRIAVNPAARRRWRVCWSCFMGQPAPSRRGLYPRGYFALPVNLMFALRQQQASCAFTVTRSLTRCRCRGRNRQQALQHIIDRYAERLEYYALQSPLDWFNFSISGVCRSPKIRSKGCLTIPVLLLK